MRTYAPKPNTRQQTKSAESAKIGRLHPTQSHDVPSIFQLQGTFGPQPVKQFLEPNAKELQAGSVATVSTRFNHDFCRIPTFSPSPVQIQPKLTVSTAGDRYEQEADRIADQIMRMPAPQLQRTWSGECAKGRSGKESPSRSLFLQTKPTLNSSRQQTSLNGTVNRLPFSGAALPADVRGFMESRFGFDFSGVRIHANNHLAPRLQARAFTIGSDIYFAPGEFQPNTLRGQRIISHELTHTIQQGAVPELNGIRAGQSPLTASISRGATAIQREVGEEQVASSSQVLARIGARVTAADAHADVVVRILRDLNSAIPEVDAPALVTQLRALIAHEALFRAATVNLLRLIELGVEFNPGAGPDSPNNAFVYTCRCGWIDMGHFFISAAVAYGAGFLLRFVDSIRIALGGTTAAETSLIIGWLMEHFQEALRQFVTGPFGGLLTLAPAGVQEAIMGNVRSAFTVEDLPSDKFGAEIGQEVFEDWEEWLAAVRDPLGIFSSRTGPPAPFDILNRMTRFFSDCVAVFPTGHTRRAMIEETIGTGPLPRQHFTTEPLLLTTALGLCPVPETTPCPTVNERGWERAHPAGMIEEASDHTTLWNFAVNVAALKAEHQQRLRQAAAAAPAGAMIMVEGYASCSGSSAHNERLARSRAESAAAFLRALRPDLRVGMIYFGEREPRPAVTAGDGEAMARNRRVEIYLVDVARYESGFPEFQLPTRAPLPMPHTEAIPADVAAGSERVERSEAISIFD